MAIAFINQFKISTDNPDAVHCYLEDIFEDISKPSIKIGVKCIDFIAFHDFINFPMLISEKIFNTIKKNDCLFINKESFVNGMLTLFCVNSIDLLTKFLFNMLDFKSKGNAHAENIKVCLSQLHMKTCHNLNTLQLNKIIDEAIGEECLSMDYQCFINKLKENSDVLYLFLVFIYQRFNKEKESIDYYANVICRDLFDSLTMKKAYDSEYNGNIDYAAPSQLILNYMKDNLYIDYCIDEQDNYYYLKTHSKKSSIKDNNSSFNEYFDNETNELSELEDFENDIQSCMLKNSLCSIRHSFTLSYCRKQTEKQRSMKPLAPIDLTFNKNEIEHSSFLVHSFSTTAEHQKSNKINEFICISTESIKDAVQPQKKKMILIANSLFYFIYDDYSHCYIYSGVHYLQKNYIITQLQNQGQCFDNDNNKIVSLISDYGNFYKSTIYSFDDQRQYHKFCEHITIALNYHDIKDDIEIKEEIDCGSCGKIFSGYSNKLNKKVAVKIINKKGKSKAELKLIRWEKDIVEYLTNVSHKYVMETYGTYEDEANIYLILENIKGYALSFDGLQCQYDKKVIMRQIVEAIEFLHEHNIIHRDIKPCNIMFQSCEKNIKVVDFGFSRILTRNDYAREYCGSLNFSAPEVVLNKPYNRSIDIWSLGVLLFWLQYGILPFQSKENDRKGTSINIINGKIINQQTGFLKDQLLINCFQLDPKERTSFECIYDLIVY